ncbi:DNA replication regulator SLD2 [Arthroderma uncinatum]|uniref:DNA replication regulator SLD2 n=1 Tax=Arthroderma uncinatum TaxID=74035 RepID=UPI00144A7D9D|nr:DNA replication regulator SLD2 [Arthroderma uncinatum]KAF3479969.1 DNA replication regulator SLD2 [Arthroderma uncinatum]
MAAAGTDADGQATALRAELKQWEKTFTLHASRKPGREDIKNDPVIAEKYKEYARLRSECSRKPGKGTGAVARPHEQQHQTPKKRAKRNCPFEDDDDEGTAKTPTKLCTPSRNAVNPLHPSCIDPYDSPSNIRRLNGPRESPLPLQEVIGPTPQRDGKALGLFDLVGSPSQKTPIANRHIAAAGIAQTPSRKVAGTPSTGGSATATARRLRYASTPLSSARKFYLSSFFATPTANRCLTIAEDEGVDDDARGALESETPSFLRRKNFLSPAAKGRARSPGVHSPVPVAVRMPQKLFGKGISSFAKRLQDGQNADQEETVDDSEDRVEETQIFSDPEVDGEEGDAAADANKSPSKTYKTYKKKGQKRTTKLSRLRPSRNKPVAQPRWESLVEESDDELPASRTSVPPDGNDSSDDPEGDGTYMPKKSRAKPVKPGLTTGAENKPEKKLRKIKAEAHANYRSLKIRSRGGQKGGGRFGRR